MHKYSTIVRDIRSKITAGEYAQGERLPTTPELCEQYGVSKITVRRAMDDLEAMGLVARRRGSGTYVKGAAVTREFSEHADSSRQMGGFMADAEALGASVRSDMHEFLVVQPPTDVAEYLGMEPDEFAYYVCRTRIRDEVPEVVEYTYMPLRVVPDLREKHVRSSIYRYIEDDLGLRIASAHRIVCAVHPTEDECRRLGVEPRTPLIQVRQVGYLDDGRPFEVSTVTHRPGYEFYSVSKH